MLTFDVHIPEYQFDQEREYIFRIPHNHLADDVYRFYLSNTGSKWTFPFMCPKKFLKQDLQFEEEKDGKYHRGYYTFSNLVAYGTTKRPYQPKSNRKGKGNWSKSRRN
jgi:hypothetical protein